MQKKEKRETRRKINTKKLQNFRQRDWKKETERTQQTEHITINREFLRFASGNRWHTHKQETKKKTVRKNDTSGNPLDMK